MTLRKLVVIAALGAALIAQSPLAAAQTSEDPYAVIARATAGSESAFAMSGQLASVVMPSLEPLFVRAGIQDAQQRQAFADAFAAEVSTILAPSFYEATYAATQQRFAPAEAAEIAAFLSTSAGQAYIDAAPLFSRVINDAGREQSEAVAGKALSATAGKLAAGETAMDPEAARKLADLLSQTAP